MDYAEQLQKINQAKEAGNAADLESIRYSVEQDRLLEENMGNTMVLMAAEKALEKLGSHTGVSTSASFDQITRTGGTPDDVTALTAGIDDQINKSELKGRITILSAIPENMRTTAQQQELAEAHTRLGTTPEVTIKSSYVPTSKKMEYDFDFSKANELPDYAQMAKNGPSYQELANGTMENYAGNMESQIASGSSLWDTPTDAPEPMTFSAPTQSPNEDINKFHKNYLKQQIDTVSKRISEGSGTEADLERGMDLENRLAEYSKPKVEVTIPQVEDNENVVENNNEDVESTEQSFEEQKEAIQAAWEQELENPDVDMETYINSRNDISDEAKLRIIDSKENETAGKPRAIGAFKYLAGKISAEEFMAPGKHEFGDGTYGFRYKRTMPNLKQYADQYAAAFKPLYDKINTKYQDQLDELEVTESYADRPTQAKEILATPPPIPQQFSVPEADASSILEQNTVNKPSVENSSNITPLEFNAFIDSGIVSFELLKSIANKIKIGEKLTQEELAIHAAKTVEIEGLLRIYKEDATIPSNVRTESKTNEDTKKTTSEDFLPARAA
ncbi:MAG TPA: hypothetical protein PKZ56_02375 [Candidatus Paceibacterota bacterium]|nr:hypothetical protein [Candidatus Paceibacterota bacterium]